jgi:hypothetical protein
MMSCSPEGDEVRYNFEFLAIESVELPDTLVLGQTHEIKVTYKRPTSCHVFNAFYYEKNLNVRTIAVNSIVTQRNDCVTLDNVIEEASINFYVTNNGSYIFKFWQGKDENGEDLFLEIEVPVED